MRNVNSVAVLTATAQPALAAGASNFTLVNGTGAALAELSIRRGEPASVLRGAVSWSSAPSGLTSGETVAAGGASSALSSASGLPSSSCNSARAWRPRSVRLVSPFGIERRAELAEPADANMCSSTSYATELLRRGLVPRTFGAGHPLAHCLRVTIRDRRGNDRLSTAAREIEEGLR